MKASLKLREEEQKPLLRAKIPVSVLGLPFISGISTGDSSDLSFHVRTASPTGPSMKLSYQPNHPHNPFSLSLKSGVAIWGSPENSPLIMTAHFSLIGRLNPSFSLHIKPDFGDFTLRKTTTSLNPNPNPNKHNGGVHSHLNGDDGAAMWREFNAGVAMTAKTVLPVMKQAAVKFRWGVNFPAEFGRQKLPFLTVDKVSIERVEEVKPEAGNSVLKPMESIGDLEVLKGMCVCMGREMEILQKENRSMKESIEGLTSRMRSRRENVVSGKKTPEIEDFRVESLEKKKNGGVVDGRKEVKSGGFPGAPAADIGEELKRAIKAASS
ncbi:uncharacterized protein LOC143877220 [Tasmannia lanceolata]|uniref:uncharacterized protein LOC143877220 n=1 Tax=Tasmannia lanceolata TaxID=3420 RepID=UPI004063A7E8